MNKYKELIASYRVKDKNGHRSAKRLFNATKEHAITLIENILQVAAEDNLPVKVVSGELHSDVYDSLLDALGEVIVKDLEVEVVVLDCETDIAKNKFAQLVARSAKGTIFKGISEPKMQVQIKDFPHFILAGTECLRVETDHGQTKAEAYFYNPALGGSLSKYFDVLKNSGLVQEVPKHVSI